MTNSHWTKDSSNCKTRILAACSWKILDGRPFVRGFDIMEFAPMYSMENFPLCTFFLITRNLISICFDLIELLLLLDYKTVDLLLQYNLCGMSISFTICSPVTRFVIQIPWLDASKHIINFSAMMDEVIRVCLTLRQEIAPLANM